ncbi:hypothetical protein GC163_04025 [bacterium]|nr:hypothetical protein [bacterium]
MSRGSIFITPEHLYELGFTYYRDNCWRMPLESSPEDVHALLQIIDAAGDWQPSRSGTALWRIGL